ncbi:MAG: uroporphyrinogen decarboxylase family protein [Oscillospiraceae bacterium]
MSEATTLSQSSCRFENSDGVMETLNSLQLTFEEMYSSSETIADFAVALKEKRGQNFCTIPFCHTIEAEALGGEIHLGDKTAGSRAGKLVYSSIEEIILHKLFEKNDGRIYLMLKACEILKKRGETVVFTVSGPFSILCCLMDTTSFFKIWRKEPEKAQKYFDHISKEVLDFAQHICESGADYLSFADPVGTPSILGPKFSKMMAENFTVPFLKELSKQCLGKTKILICPMTAASLISTNLGEIVDIIDEDIISPIIPVCIKSPISLDLVKKTLKLL